VFAMARSRVRDDDMAEEITQSVFATIATKLTRDGYDERGRFESWLFRITMNRVRDEFRRLKRHAATTDPCVLAESGAATMLHHPDEVTFDAPGVAPPVAGWRQDPSGRPFGRPGAAQQPRRLPPGAERWPALALCSGVVGIALLLPAGMLVWWLARGLIAGVGIDDAQRMLAAAWRTGSVSAAAAIVAAVVGLPIAWLSVRRASRSSRALERLSYIGYALPGIPVALGLVYLGIRWVRPLYQTMPMLLLAYLTLFLPLAVGSVRGALLQVDQRLEAAARTLGSGPISAFRSVTLPLIMPGVGAGAALVMLSAMKELQATLILGPYGFGTLAMMVWSRVSEAMFAAAALPALALIVLASVPTALLTFRRGERPVSPS